MLNIKSYPLGKVNYLSQLTKDYIEFPKKVKDFYHYDCSINGLKAAINDKNTSIKNRVLLKNSLLNQYQNWGMTPDIETLENIESLQNDDTFTITTGQQLHLFMGQFFFPLKIQELIHIAKALNQTLEQNIVPIFWLASEDHDFDEIKTTKLYGQYYDWNTEQEGPVGRFKLQNINKLINQLSERLDKTEQNLTFMEALNDAYLNSDNLAQATAKLINTWFKNTGLVIIDGDNQVFKATFKKVIKNDILQGISFENIKAQNNELKKSSYSLQVKAKPINHFYLGHGKRERIIPLENRFGLIDSTVTWSSKEMENMIDETPENFSPNALLRPLYQETILPNILYLGGGAEIAYWFQLKTTFEQESMKIPVLKCRDSYFFQGSKMTKILNKLHLNIEDLFYTKDKLIANYHLNNNQNTKQSLELLGNITNSFLEWKNLNSAAFNSKPLYHKHVKNLEKALLYISENHQELFSDSVLENDKDLSKLLDFHEQLFTNSQRFEKNEYAINYLELMNDLNYELDRSKDTNQQLNTNLNIIFT